MSIVVTITIPITIIGAIAIFFRGNIKFFKIINRFHKNLPPTKMKAKVSANPIVMGITQMDVSTMKTDIGTKELYGFLKELELFNYKSVFFRRKGIITYSNNIQRIINGTDWVKFNVVVLQQLFEDEIFECRKPYLFGRKIGKFMKF